MSLPIHGPFPRSRRVLTLWCQVAAVWLLGICCLHAGPFPIAEWKFNEAAWTGAGAEVVDASGNLHHGTALNGAAIVEDSERGPVGQFNGIDQVVVVPDVPSLNPGAALTIAAWVNPNAFPVDAFVAGKSNFAESGTYALYIERSTGNTPQARFLIGVTAADIITGTSTLVAGQWVHLAGTYDGTTIRLYVNGTLEASSAAAGRTLTNPYDFTIGRDSIATYFPFDGLIDDVRLYSTALSQQQIAYIRDGLQPDGLPDFILEEAQTLDVNRNGFLDTIQLLFSRDVDDATVSIDDFSITPASSPMIAVPPPGGANDHELVIKIADNLLGTDVLPTVQYTPGGLKSVQGIALTETSIIPVDQAVPVVMAASHEPAIGRLVIELSEPVVTTAEALDLAGVSLHNAAGLRVTLHAGNQFQLDAKALAIALTSSQQSVVNTILPDPLFIDVVAGAFRDTAGNESSASIGGVVTVDSTAIPRFSTPLAIGSQTSVFAPVLAVSGDEPTITHIAFYNPFGFDSDRHVFYMRQIGVDGPFSNPVNVSFALGNLGSYHDPAIAARGSLVLVAWQRAGKILIARSTDSGATFSSKFELVQDQTPAWIRQPRLAIDPVGNAHLIWHQQLSVDGVPQGANVRYGFSPQPAGGSGDDTAGADGSWAVESVFSLADTFYVNPALAIHTPATDPTTAATSVFVVTQRIAAGSGSLRFKGKLISESWNAADERSVAAVGTAPTHADLAADDEGNVYVAFADGTQANPNLAGANPMMIAQFSANEWMSPYQIGTGYSPSLAIRHLDGGTTEIQATWYEPRSGSDSDFSVGGDIRFWRAITPVDPDAFLPRPVTVSLSSAHGIQEYNPQGPVEDPDAGTGLKADFLLGVPDMLVAGGITTVAWVDNTAGRNRGIMVAREGPGIIPDASGQPPVLIGPLLVDDFSPPDRYNIAGDDGVGNNDVVILPSQPAGGATDDDGTMNLNIAGSNVNDRIELDGYLTLRWDNGDNGPLVTSPDAFLRATIVDNVASLVQAINDYPQASGNPFSIVAAFDAGDASVAVLTQQTGGGGGVPTLTLSTGVGIESNGFESSVARLQFVDFPEAQSSVTLTDAGGSLAVFRFAAPPDYWYTTLFPVVGADLRNITHLILRGRQLTGTGTIDVGLTTADLRSITLPLPPLSSDFTTLSMNLSAIPASDLAQVTAINLTFRDQRVINPGAPDVVTVSTGELTLDTILLDDQAHPDEFETSDFSVADTGVTLDAGDLRLASGQTLQFNLRVLDHQGQAIPMYDAPIGFSISEGFANLVDGTGAAVNRLVFDGSGIATGRLRIVACDGQQHLRIVDGSGTVLILPVTVTNPDCSSSADVSRLRITPFLDPAERSRYQHAGEFSAIGVNATFPITIEALNALDVPVTGGIGEVHIDTIGGGFRLVPGDAVTSTNTMSMLSNPTTVYGFLDNPGPQRLRTTIARDGGDVVNSSDLIVVREQFTAEPELDFLQRMMYEDGGVGLIETELRFDEAGAASGDGTFRLYANALAVIVFTHKAYLDPPPTVRARDRYRDQAVMILSTLRDHVPRPTGADAGGFFDSYKFFGGVFANRDDLVTTGNNAWLLMAINYYTIYSGDEAFVGIGHEIATVLRHRQGANGGVYSRENLQTTFVAEHQAEALSALRFFSALGTSAVTLTEKAAIRASADAVQSFIVDTLFDDTTDGAQDDRFRVAVVDGGYSNNDATDAQTASFMALHAVGADLSTYGSALDFALANLTGQHVDPMAETITHGRDIFGARFRIVAPPEQHLWIEGTGQLALALALDSIAGSNRAILLENMSRVQHAGGGYPTYLGTQFQEGAPAACDDCDVQLCFDQPEAGCDIPVYGNCCDHIAGTDELGVVPATWAYFNKSLPVVNPYFPQPTTVVTQSKILVSTGAEDEVVIAANLIGIVEEGFTQSVTFELLNGNGTLRAAGDQCTAAQTPCRLTVLSDASGVASVRYVVADRTDNTNAPDIAEIAVELDGVVLRNVFVLQDYIESFDRGLAAGGEWVFFGNALESAGLTTPGRNGSGAALRLTTGSPGLVGGAAVLGMTKEFAQAADASPFNGIAYWIGRTQTSGQDAVSFLELVVGDGGGNAASGKTGSTWAQRAPTTVGDVYRRIACMLDEDHFVRTVSDAAGGGTLDGSNITAVRLLIAGVGDASAGVSSFDIDDLLFFRGFAIDVVQEKVFIRADGTTRINVLVTVRDAAGTPQPDVGLRFMQLSGDGSVEPQLGTTGLGGTVSFQYNVGPSPALTEIRVEQDNGN